MPTSQAVNDGFLLITNKAFLLLSVASAWGMLIHHPQLGLDQRGQAAGQLLPWSVNVTVAQERSTDPTATMAVSAGGDLESRQRLWVSWNQHSDGGMLPQRLLE